MGNWLKKLFKVDKKHLARIEKDAEEVLSFEEEMAKLSDEELKAVFADIKRQAEIDPVLHAMMKAREAELKFKSFEEAQLNSDETKTEPIEASTTETTKL